jgi:uncharacterized Zn finger protein
MPRRNWDDRWHQYPASVPLPTEDGIASSKQRGKMADSWWSQRFTEVLESYGLGTRMQRGRRYARQGQVLSLEVRPPSLVAQVQGSRRTPYLVTISLPQPTDAQWHSIDAAIAAKVGFVARLLAGELPHDLEEVFGAAGVELFPASWPALSSECSCPDWENPCKHIAAVLYLFADQLDADPWLLLAWRGRTREQILEALRGRVSDGLPGDTSGDGRTEVAPWWPFAPGPLPDLPVPALADLDHQRPDPPDAVLAALEPLEVRFPDDTRFIDALGAVYEHIVEEDAAEEPPVD